MFLKFIPKALVFALKKWWKNIDVIMIGVTSYLFAHFSNFEVLDWRVWVFTASLIITVILCNLSGYVSGKKDR